MRQIARLAHLATVIAVILALGFVQSLRADDYVLSDASRWVWLVTYGLLAAGIGYGFGLPEQRLPRQRFSAALTTALVTPIAFSVLQSLLDKNLIPRLVLVLSAPALLCGLALSSWAISWASQSASDRERVILVCDDADYETTDQDVAAHAEVPCSLIGHFRPDDPRLGDLGAIAAAEGATLIVVADTLLGHPSVAPAVALAHMGGVRIRTMTDFYFDWVGKVPLRHLRASAMLFDIREIHQIGYLRLSRALDVFLAAIGLVPLLIVTPFVLIGNLLANRGPLIFSQPRIGRGQREFRIHKFRSMKPGDTTGEWTRVNDSRITPFGKFLRLSHIDELPQVINILKGDLSVVGPRPEQPHYVDELTEKIPFYRSRHLVRPGLTGWAQVNYPYGADEIDAYQKLQYEIWYLNRQSLWTDIRIIARTVRHVVGFRGR